MMRRLNLLFAAQYFFYQAYTQSIGGVNNATSLDMNLNNYGFITELKPERLAKVTGNSYYYEQWLQGNIRIDNGIEIKDKPVRFNMRDNILEVKDGNRVVGIEGRRVAYFLLHLPDGSNGEFYQSSEYNFGGTRLYGFLNFIVRGDWSLVSHEFIEEVKSAYIPSLDAGHNEVSLVKKKRMLLLKNKELTEITKNKKDFIAKFPDPVADYIKSEKLNLKETADLITLVNFLNSTPALGSGTP